MNSPISISEAALLPTEIFSKADSSVTSASSAMALTSCCHCLDLRKGTMAIGIFYVIMCALGILLSVVFLAVGPEMIIRPLIFSKIDFSTVIAILFAIRILLWVTLILCVLLLFISGLLIRGVTIESPCMVLTWLIAQGIVLVLATIGYIYQLIAAIGSGAALSITIAVFSLIWAAVQWYWFAVVVAFYQLVSATDTMQKILQPGMNRVQPTPPLGTVSDGMQP